MLTVDYQGAALPVGQGTSMRNPMWARVPYYYAMASAGDGKVMARIAHRDENEEWVVLANDPQGPIELTATPKHGIIEIPVVDSKQDIRLEIVFTGGPTNPRFAVGDAYLSHVKR
jgi:hypothetical protein